MQSWQGTGGREQPDWRALAEISSDLKAANAALDLPPDKEWLRFVLGEISDQMQGTIRWAEDMAPRLAAEDAEDYTPPSIVPADAARSDLVVAIYCLDFLRSEGLIETSLGEELNQRLTSMQTSIEALLVRLRQAHRTAAARFPEN